MSGQETSTGRPCWADLWTSDVDRARAFYADLLGWTAEEPSPEFGGYFMFTRNGGPIAGGMGDMGDMKANNSWKVYLSTTDLEQTLKAVESSGGTVVGPAMPVADLGVQAVAVDAVGSTFGLWQPGTFAGFQVSGEPGTPSWFELRTTEYERALDFYTSVFGLVANPIEAAGVGYSTLRDPDGNDLAGVMDASSELGEGDTGSWQVSWVTSDLDGSLATVDAHGGSRLTEATDTPWGRFAAVADPLGARFTLHAPPGGRR